MAKKETKSLENDNLDETKNTELLDETKSDETDNLEVICIVPYFDKELEKNVLNGDVITVSPERAAVLKSKGLIK